MKTIKEKFRLKYLLTLLILPVIFLVTGTNADETVAIYSMDELREYVRYRVSLGTIPSEFHFYPEHSESFPKFIYNDDPVICETILDTVYEELPFLKEVVGCSSGGLGMNGGYTSIRVNLSTSNIIYTEYGILQDYFADEVKKMILENTDKATLVKDIRIMINDMLAYNSSNVNYGHPIFDRFSTDPNMGLPFSSDLAVMSHMFALALEQTDIEYELLESKVENYDDDYYIWPLVKIKENWYHCHPSLKTECLVSDSYISQHINFDKKYPTAPKNYQSTAKEVVESVPKVEVKRPDLDYISPGEYYMSESAENRAEKASDWAYPIVVESIKADLVPDELTRGYKSDILRDEFCGLIVNLYEKLSGEEAQLPAVNLFEDTNDENVLKAKNLGIITGFTETQFGGEHPITREQIATMFARTIYCFRIRIPNVSDEYVEFADETDINDYAKDSVQLLNKLGIMNGVGNNRIDPFGLATKEQAIVLSNRMYNYFK